MGLIEALKPAIKTALAVGVPISVGFLAYEMSPRFGALSEEDQAAVRVERDAAGFAVSASALSVLASAGVLLWAMGSK